MTDKAEFQRLLDRLEHAWRLLDAPVLQHLRPGLADDLIDELVSAAGLTIPDDLRWWWQWHDGAVAPGPYLDSPRVVGPGGWVFDPLSEALEVAAIHDEYYQERINAGDQTTAAMLWRPGLFPFVHRTSGNNCVLAMDPLNLQGGSAPVIMTSNLGIEDHFGGDSLFEVVSIWVELLEAGKYHVVDGSLQPVDWSDTGTDSERRVL